MALADVLVGGGIGVAGPVMLYGLQSWQVGRQRKADRAEAEWNRQFTAAREFFRVANGFIMQGLTNRKDAAVAARILQELNVAHADLLILCPYLVDPASALYEGCLAIFAEGATAKTQHVRGGLDAYRSAMVRHLLTVKRQEVTAVTTS